jgi:hypothetical protein
MKYAICVWGQLRAVSVVIEALKKYVIDPLHMDLFVCVQTTDTPTDKHIRLFPTKNKIIYKPTDVTKTFKNYDKLLKKNNYINIPYLNVYENWYKIYQLWGKKLETYEYVVMTRSDYLHLLPFPDISTLYPKKDLFWVYNGHEFEGINNSLIVVPSKHICSYLTCAYDFLQDSSNIHFLNIQPFLNTEIFFKLLFQHHHWKIGKIQLNAFITTSGKNEITTWGKIEYSKKYKVFYKYKHQLNDAYASLKQYKTRKWVRKNKKIILGTKKIKH